VSRRVLIAGGAGFIGSHLSEHLLDSGAEVVVVDNLLTGSRDNVAHLTDRPGFELIVADARSLDTVPGRFDLVFHLASPASPIAYQRYPLETLHAGSVVTEALLERALHDRARFVVASTSEVYGDPLVHPQEESYWGNVNPIGPRSMYDEAKRYAEAVTATYARTYGVNAAIARIFNTYGPRMARDDGRVVPAFIGAAIAGRDLPIHGDGSQTRSLCFVTDLVAGLVALADSGQPGPINLGNPREESLRDLAARIVAIAGTESGLEFHPRPTDDPERRRPDITKARELLDWAPQVDIDDGLAQTVAWYRGEAA
jgi:dTDP-glucose 4,6-dehydratase